MPDEKSGVDPASPARTDPVSLRRFFGPTVPAGPAAAVTPPNAQAGQTHSTDSDQQAAKPSHSDSERGRGSGRGDRGRAAAGLRQEPERATHLRSAPLSVLCSVPFPVPSSLPPLLSPYRSHLALLFSSPPLAPPRSRTSPPVLPHAAAARRSIALLRTLNHKLSSHGVRTIRHVRHRGRSGSVCGAELRGKKNQQQTHSVPVGVALTRSAAVEVDSASDRRLTFTLSASLYSLCSSDSQRCPSGGVGDRSCARAGAGAQEEQRRAAAGRAGSTGTGVQIHRGQHVAHEDETLKAAATTAKTKAEKQINSIR